MNAKTTRVLTVALFAFALAGCGSQAAPVPLGSSGGAIAPARVAQPAVSVAGVYNGTVVESSQGNSIKAKLKITIKQSGSHFTGIFDIILKTLQDQFPIEKGVVSTEKGKTVLHFVIEGSPGRNAKAFAGITGSKLNGRAKVSGKNGPVVHFKYATTKA
ncbi:MAG TPA: hypothetical protein VGX91_09025 [Candidatus Cybelea sp.]|jgi:hypothetical protein|nr:hypothetical protein [Candidatus Cybelea sp.]